MTLSGRLLSVPTKMAWNRSVVVVVAFLSAALCWSCRQGTGDVDPLRMEAQYNERSGVLELLVYDWNANAQPDTWVHMNGALVSRIEIDDNEDGLVDRWEYYDPNRGVLLRAEEDTTGDGLPDTWETYRNGAVTSVAVDTTHRGSPDRLFVYGPGGVLERMVIDEDSAGQLNTLTPGRTRENR